MEATDGSSGVVKSNGTVTGMVGMVTRRETHFAINQITETGDNNLMKLQLWHAIPVTIMTLY